jgi:hypothetical protein
MYASLMTVGGVGKRSRRGVYLCRYHKDRGAAYCAQPPVTTASVDQTIFAAVQRQMRTWSLTVEAEPMPIDGASGPAVNPASLATALAQAEARCDRLRASLNELKVRAPATLRDRLIAAEAEVTRLATLVQRQAGVRSQPSGPHWDFRRRPQATWNALDHAGRREVLKSLLTKVVIRGRAVVALSVRNDRGESEAVPLPAATDV